MNNVVQIKNLTKYYDNFCALDDVSFDVERGKVFALLGPNGAGKSTLVKCLLGLAQVRSGELLVNDISCLEKAARNSISYLPEKFSFYPFYKVKAVLEFFCSLKNIKGDNAKEQINDVARKMNISDLFEKKVSTLSKGQLQRVGLAITLLGDADLIILDEPFSGLDPIAIKDLKNLIIELKEKGKTIFFNSHLLVEMEQLCDSCALLDKGKLLAVGDLKDMLQGGNLEDFFYNKIKGTDKELSDEGTSNESV